MKKFLISIIYTTALLLLFVADGSAKQEQRFVLLTSTGIVSDSKTGLEWKVGPDKDTDWDQACDWVQKLKRYGGG